MRVRIFRKLPTDLAKRVNNFELKNFYQEGEKTPERLAEQQEKYFSTPKAWLLAFDKEQIIGRIMLHRRKIKFNNESLILGGIGGVCTHKNKRRQGTATMMLKGAMKILEKWGRDVAYFCTDIKKLGPLYTKVGFVPLNKPTFFYGQSGKLYEDNYGMIAPITSPSRLQKILKSKQKFNLGVGNW